MLFPALLAIVIIAFAIVARWNIKHAIILLLALTPTYLVRFSIGPVPMTLLECFVLVVIGTFVIQNPLRLPRPWSSYGQSPHKWGRERRGLVLFGVVICVLSVMIAPDTLSALGILKAYIVEPILLGMILANTFDRDDYRRALNALIASGAVIGLLAILQVIFHIGIPDAWAIENRATSIFPYPNAVGLLLAPLVSAGVVMVSETWSRYRTSPSPSLVRRGIAVTGALVLMLGGIVAAETEAALVAIPAALFVVALMSTVSKKMKVMVAGVSILGAIVIGIAVPSIVNKISLYDSSGLVRRTQWSETFRMLADRPFLGTGLNGYPAALAPYHDATFYEIFQYPHNIFLNVWSELGIFGLSCLLALMVALAEKTWRHRDDPFSLACFVALLTMSIHGLVDVPFFKNDLAIVTMFFVVGVLVKKKK